MGQATTLPPNPAGATVAGWSDDHAGRQIGGYRLTRELGSGGMGVVWEAEQINSGRRVAIKLLSPGRDHSSDALDRFVREGRLAAALSHPRSTFVFEAGTDDGRPFISMELMPGRTLADVCKEEGPLPPARAVDLVLDVIEGLDAAHGAGVIHRDVKPSNCFLDSDGRVKVGDFGLSKSLVDDTALTRTGAFLGTPMFAAPEQVRGDKVDCRTDVYSVGAMLFSMIAGRPPFKGMDAAAVIAQIACDPAPRLRTLRPAIPQDLDRVIAKTLEKEPAKRFQTLAELKTALQPFSTLGLAPAPPGRRLAAYIIDVILSTIVAVAVGTLVLFVGIISSIGESFLSFGQNQPGNAFRNYMYIVLGVFLIATMGYFAFMEGIRGASLAKRWLGLRVVRADGDRPGPLRALLRSFLIPGLSWILSFVIMAMNPDAAFGQTLSRRQMVLQQFLNLLPVVPTALCLAAMRARNGYRGLHDLATGTRVVMLRPNTESGWGVELPVMPRQDWLDAPKSYGPFEVRGLIGRCGDATVLAAIDNVLKRRAWIVTRPRDAAPVSTQRTQVARATRQRWLQSGENESERWDAYEALFGVPWVEFPYLDWEHGRRALLDIAKELNASVEDGTLPSNLSIAHAWLDMSGRAALLDSAFDDEAAPIPDESTESAAEKAMKVLRQAVRLSAKGPDLPVHAVEFVNGLAQRPNDQESLRWALAQLQEMAARPALLRWYDRLISVGANFGIDFEIFQIAMNLTALALLAVDSLVALAIAITLLAIILPFAIGYWSRGGVAFALIGIAVRRADGQAPSRLRCGVRNVVAWIVPMIAFGSYMAVIPMFMEGAPAQNPGAAAGTPALHPGMVTAGLASCSAALLQLFTFVCAIYGIARPNRGLQDLIAGTRLVPK
jgi:uncharacterized RDD family membrane protein YckC